MTGRPTLVDGETGQTIRQLTGEEVEQIRKSMRGHSSEEIQSRLRTFWARRLRIQCNCNEGGDTPAWTLRQQISGAIHLVEMAGRPTHSEACRVMKETGPNTQQANWERRKDTHVEQILRDERLTKLEEPQPQQSKGEQWEARYRQWAQAIQRVTGDEHVVTHPRAFMPMVARMREDKQAATGWIIAYTDSVAGSRIHFPKRMRAKSIEVDTPVQVLSMTGRIERGAIALIRVEQTKHNYYEPVSATAFHATGVPPLYPSSSPDESQLIHQTYRALEWIGEKHPGQSVDIRICHPDGLSEEGHLEINASGGEIMARVSTRLPNVEEHLTLAPKSTTEPDAWKEAASAYRRALIAKVLAPAE